MNRHKSWKNTGTFGGAITFILRNFARTSVYTVYGTPIGTPYTVRTRNGNGMAVMKESSQPTTYEVNWVYFQIARYMLLSYLVRSREKRTRYHFFISEVVYTEYLYQVCACMYLPVSHRNRVHLYERSIGERRLICDHQHKQRVTAMRRPTAFVLLALAIEKNSAAAVLLYLVYCTNSTK